MGNCATQNEIISDVSAPTKFNFSTTDTLFKQKVDLEQQSSFFNDIIPWFQHVHQSEQKRSAFYDRMANKMGQLYSVCMNKMEQKMLKDSMGTDDLKANISKIILLQIICMINQLQKSKNWKQQRQTVFINISNCQRKIIEFLKFKYPRNKKAFVPTELQQTFQQLDDSQHTDYDILINAKIYFNYEDVINYQRQYIFKQMKTFMNLLIKETNKFFQHFRQTMDSCFQGVQGSFKIGRKISQNTNIYHDIQSQHFEIHSPELFRIIIKWISSMQGVFADTSNALHEVKYFRISEENQDYSFSYFPLYTNKQQIINSLMTELEKTSKQFKKKLQDQQQNLANFNDNLIRMILRKTDTPEINHNQIKTIKYGSYVSKFIEFLAIEKLQYLLTQLVKLRRVMQNKIRKGVDLINFNVYDLLRAQFMGNKKDILKIYSKLQALQKQGKIQVIRIKNRLDTPLNDVLLNFIFTGEKSSFLVCELQLVLKKNQDQANKKVKAYQIFNHVLYQLQRAIFGPMAQMSLFLTHNDTRMGFQRKIKLQKHKLQSLRCPDNQVLIQQNDLNVPYCCSLCCKFYTLNENTFPIHRCLNCNYYVCPRCLFDFDPDYELQSYQKEMAAYMKQKINLWFDQGQDNGFFFFDKKYFKASKFTAGNKNFFTGLQDQMIKRQINYMGVLQFKAGQRFLKIYTVNSGQIRPVFYELLPRNQRKDFRKQKFGDFDIVLRFIERDDMKIIEKGADFPIVPISLVPEIDLTLKKVKHNKLFKWGKNFFQIDIGDAIRQNNQSQDRHNSKKIKQLDKIMSKYKPKQGKLEVDYLDLMSIAITNKQISNLRFAKLSNNHLRDIIPILQFDSLQEMDASFNDLAFITFNKKLPKLRTIDLSQNYIDKIEKLDSNMLPALKQLKLKSNNLLQFPILDLPNLVWLNINQNGLQSIKNIVKSNLPKLRRLQLNNNKIKQIPEVELKSLADIQMEQNLIIDIRPIASWKKLQRFEFYKNQILDIPMLSLDQLKQIDLSQNKISNIDELSNCKLPNLQTLDLSNNKIKSINKINNFQSLTNINLSSNQLINITELLSVELKYIKKLNLSKNKIDIITNLQTPALEELDISYNQLKDINFIIHAKVNQIRDLNASHNKIVSLPSLDIQYLQVLDVQYNNINNLDNFQNSQFPCLRKLKLGHNALQKFFSADFPVLEKLQLQNNKISKIDQIKEQNLSALKILKLNDNKLTFLPTMHLSSIAKMEVVNNQISDLTRFKYSTLKTLEQLDMTKNELKSFPAINLQNLRILTLSENKIESLSDLADGIFPKLQQLYLDQNKLHKLSTLKLKKLSILNLQKNELRHADDLQDFQTPQINDINLSFNKIKTIKAFQSKSLGDLNLSKNQIEKIDLFMKKSKLPKLYNLDFQENKIQGSLPPMKFPLLKMINFNKNKIEDLSHFAQDSDLPKLNVLKLAHNNIHRLPPLCFPKLKQIDLAHNNLQQIASFGQDSKLPKILKIFMSNNKLFQLPYFSDSFKTLTYINVGWNEIQQIKYFCEGQTLANLQKLTIKNNKISKWPQVSFFDSLIQLNISDNLLTSFEQISFVNFPELTQLNLKNNRIKNLHKIQLPKLTKIALDGNQIGMTNKELKDYMKQCKVHTNVKVTLQKGITTKQGEPIMPLIQLKKKSIQ